MCKPNVVIVQTDQQSLWTLSCYGGDEIETPHIDTIAKDGVRFENFYTVSAVCTPSRGCFMTGLYPYKHGAYRNDVPMERNVRTFAHIMSENGYRTAYIGKWHLAGGERPGWLEPEQSMGFTDCSLMFNCSHHKSMKDCGQNKPVIESEAAVGNHISYTTDFLTEKALEKIDQYRSEPFLLMLSIPDPHQPYTVRAPYNTFFPPDTVKIPPSFYEKKLPDWAEYDEWGRKRYFPLSMPDREQVFRNIKAQYCGAVKCIDDNVGKIIKKLKELNLYENTLFVFTTDHGDYMGEHGLLEKNNLYDSVYHIPLLISWPHGLPHNSVIQSYVSIVDFQPTLLTLLGLPLSGEEQGHSVNSLFTEDKPEREEVIFLHPNDVPRAGILTRDYELAYVGTGWQTDTEFTDHILFDRKNDPAQMHNLYRNPAYEDIKNHLKIKLIRHFADLGFDPKALPSVLAQDCKAALEAHI